MRTHSDFKSSPPSTLDASLSSGGSTYPATGQGTTHFYAVANWDRDYENSESRKINHCRYVCTPNKHDGRGYGRMMAHPEGERLFAAWNAIIQVASKMQKGSRGVLKDQDGPLTASDMSFKTRLKEETFEMAFEFFSDPKMGWLVKEVWNSEEKSHPPEKSGQHPDAPGKVGTEGKGREGNRNSPLPPKGVQEETENGKTISAWTELSEFLKERFHLTIVDHRGEKTLMADCNAFRTLGAGTKEILEKERQYRERYPGMAVTIKALLTHWNALAVPVAPKRAPLPPSHMRELN